MPARAMTPRVLPAEPKPTCGDVRGQTDAARERATDLLLALSVARSSDREQPCPEARAHIDRAIETTRRMVGVLERAASRLDPASGGADLSLLDDD